MLAAVSLATPASAGSLTVFPVRIQLSPDEPVQTMTVRNSGGEASRVQMRVYQWSQQAGEDVLSDTREILANPPLFEIVPETEQVARFGLRAQAADVERSYRVIVEEVPIEGSGRVGEVRTLLRLSIPIFVPPATPAMSIAWHARPGAGGVTLTAVNQGNVHIQFNRISLTRADGSAIGTRDMSTYVLPGNSADIEIPVTAALATGETIRLQALTDGGEITADIVSGSAQGVAARP